MSELVVVRQAATQMVVRLVTTIVLSIIIYYLNRVVSGVMEGAPVCRHMRKALNWYESQIAANAVEPEHIDDRLATVGGLAEIKAEIVAQVLLPLRYPHLFFDKTSSALHPPRGILLHGPPGTGKTMLARAIAAEAKVPFVALTLASLENKWFGESTKLLRATFSLARKMQPCVLFFDEIDGLLRARGDADHSCTYGMKTEFLALMDGVNTRATDAFIVIGCTNCADKLDPAVCRRLARHYHVGRPAPAELAEIFALHLVGTRVTPAEMRALVDRLPRDRLSGSDVAELVRQTRNRRLVRATESASFRELLEQKTTTATTVAEAVGEVDVAALTETLELAGVLEAEEAPPPP